MSASPSCPSREQLRDFALGVMGESQAQAIVDHLEQCEDCEQTVDNLELSADTVISAIRQPPVSDPYDAEPGCRRAQSLVEHLGQVLSTKANPSFLATPVSFPAERIGPYRLLERIGAGGMGAVYRAVHTKLDKVVALKILPAERTRDPSAVARFEREMRAVGKLDHPHLVRATDAGEIDGTHFLVMELVDGFDFSTILNCRDPLPIPDVCEAIRQAALGLQEAHRHGMVHRDIKPSNLMLARSPRAGEPPTVKILDLGLARLTGENPSAANELTSEHNVVGTLNYMAPEQLANTHGVDIRADIYSLGATLYKLLTGKLPFQVSRHASVSERVSVQTSNDVRPINAVRVDIPPGLSTVVSRMLASDPLQRYGSPQEVADALQIFSVEHDLNRLWPDAAMQTLNSGVSPSSARLSQPGSQTTPDEPSSPQASIRQARWGVVTLGLLSLAATLAYQSTRPQPFESRSDASAVAIVPTSPASSVPIGESALAIKELTIAERNRRAVDWALGIGGQVTVTAKSQSRVLRPGEELPFNDYELAIDLNRNSHVDDLGLENLRGATAIRELVLNDTSVSTFDPVLTLTNLHSINCSINILEPEDIRSLAAARSLRLLYLGNFASTPPPQEKADEIFAAACQLDQLEFLSFGSFYYSLSDAALAELSNMPQLSDLTLRSQTLTNHGVQNLPLMPELDWLALCGQQLTAAGLLHLDRQPRLEHLRLERLSLPEDELRELPDLPHVFSLVLVECQQVTGSGLSRWKVWPRIRWFRTIRMPLTDADLDAIASADSHLEWLAIINSLPLTVAAVDSIARLKRLTSLELTGCTHLTDDWIPALSQLTGLTQLNVQRTGLSPSGIARLKKSMPNTVVTHE